MSDKWSDHNMMRAMKTVPQVKGPQNIVHSSKSGEVAARVQKQRQNVHVEHFNSANLNEISTTPISYDYDINPKEKSQLKRIAVFTFEN